MLPKHYSSEAIVLSRMNFSEADRIITVYSRDYGKHTLLAKGIKKTKSRKRGALEVFSHINFSASRGKSMPIMTETVVMNLYTGIRSDLTKVSVAYFFLETLNKLTREEEVNRELFDLLNTYLTRVENENGLKSLRESYINDILVLLGFWPKEKRMTSHDTILENIVERQMNTARIGKILQQ